MGTNGDEHANGQVDVAVIGAGFAGMYMLHRLRSIGLSCRVIEAGSDVGGTWYWNRYPGARCDVESMEYSYEFDEDLQQTWDWSERYAAQPEILRYAEHVADRFDLRDSIQFRTRMTGAAFDEATNRWSLTTQPAGDDGLALMGAPTASIDARFVVLATGCLSSANLPDIAGRDSFAGQRLHTGRWPKEGVDLAGKRVAVIGTGSSAIQSIPLIAEQAESLTVFQRTPSFSVPARNAALAREEADAIKADYPAFRQANLLESGAFGSRSPRTEIEAMSVTDEERREELERRWEAGGFAFLRAYIDIMLSAEANHVVAAFVRDKIAEVVTDPTTAAMLAPDQVIGCKRLCLDTNYFETFNRDNVRLVDLRDTPINVIEPGGIRTEAGASASEELHEVDVIVFATGFDAMTGTIMAMDLVGRDGRTIQEAWEAGPVTYLGLGVPDFPNLFAVTGPGSPSVLTNMIKSIEHHVEWITDCLASMEKSGATTIEATREAADAWVAHVNAVADLTLFPTCNSWYLGANVPGKPRVFMPLIGFPPYVEQCAEVAADNYRGFALGGPTID